MGFPGRGAPRGGGFRGGGGRGGGFRGGGRGGFRQDMGPPASVTELGTFTHPCEDQLVVKCSTERVPWFNAVVYLENKQEVGKVDEIFGGIRDHLFIDPFKLFPLEKFTTPQRGGGRGGRGGRGGGRGGPRGGGRGGGFRGGGRGGPPGRGGGGFRGGGGGGGGFRGGGGGRGFGGPPNKRGRF